VLDAEMIARNGESFRHREVLADDGTCVRCHGAQGHAPARKAK
jgi:cytochrome c553